MKMIRSSSSFVDFGESIPLGSEATSNSWLRTESGTLPTGRAVACLSPTRMTKMGRQRPSDRGVRVAPPGARGCPPQGRWLADNLPLNQRPQNTLGRGLSVSGAGVHHDLSVLRRLVGRVDAGEVLDLPFFGTRVKPFRVASHTLFQGRVDKNLHKLIG